MVTNLSGDCNTSETLLLKTSHSCSTVSGARLVVVRDIELLEERGGTVAMGVLEDFPVDLVELRVPDVAIAVAVEDGEERRHGLDRARQLLQQVWVAERCHLSAPQLRLSLLLFRPLGAKAAIGARCRTH